MMLIDEVSNYDKPRTELVAHGVDSAPCGGAGGAACAVFDEGRKTQMISAWHLFWIVPISATVGAFLMGLVAGRKRDD